MNFNILVHLAPVADSILDVKRQEAVGVGKSSDLTFSGISLPTNIATIGLIFLGIYGREAF